MGKIIIIIGSLLVSGTYLSLAHLLRTEVEDITERVGSAIALNPWGENCTIIGNERQLSICGEDINLKLAKINNDVAVEYRGAFPEEPDVMIVSSNFNLDRYCILLDGIIRLGTYTAEGCSNVDN